MVLKVSLLALGAVFFTQAILSSNAQAPVKLSVYYESLCPASRNFVVTQMYPVWSELRDIMLMDINVYGKATDAPSGDGYTFACQHGPKECQGNLMLNCAKKYMAEPVYYEFSNCVMDTFTASDAGPSCAQTVRVNYTQTDHCWQSAEGQHLLHDVGLVQAKLDPSLTSVPWIFINDKFSESVLVAAQENLKEVICDAYTGEKPAACSTQ